MSSVTTYIAVWNKYRPVILRMMVDSQAGPQTYQLYNHEFDVLNVGKKPPYSFALTVTMGKPVSGIKDSAVAQSLWEMLQSSPKAAEMVSGSTFEFSVDKKMVFHVNKLNN